MAGGCRVRACAGGPRGSVARTRSGGTDLAGVLGEIVRRASRVHQNGLLLKGKVIAAPVAPHGLLRFVEPKGSKTRFEFGITQDGEPPHRRSSSAPKEVLVHQDAVGAYLYRGLQDITKDPIVERYSLRVAVIGWVAMSLGLWWGIWDAISSAASACCSGI
jgi:hypothetical protein